MSTRAIYGDLVLVQTTDNRIRTTFLSRRFHAVAVLKFGTVDALLRRIPMSQRAIRSQMARGSLSPPIADALLNELGPSGWDWVTGKTDSLTDPGVLDGNQQSGTSY